MNATSQLARACGSTASLAAIALLAACDRPDGPPTPDPLAGPPIDPAVVAAVDQTLAWQYRRQTETDLDGDGGAERITLTSDVSVGGGGAPIWEDGHRWAAYVEEPEGRTLVYSAFVPNGFVEGAIAAPVGSGDRAILIVERTPGQLRVLEIDYDGPGEAALVTAAHYPLDSWLPGFASLR